ncbi:MAG: ABC transporter permease [Bacteroidota bacterium]|nr:ABC transporter permease [Bacteroidota bacterium]
MFDIDKWQEIFSTIRKNKLRTFLTAFGVFWGILMLVLLLGAGQGLENSFHRDFSADAKKAIFIFTGRTSMSNQGLSPGRNIQFSNDDVGKIKGLQGVNKLSPRNRLFGEFTLNRKTKNGSFQVFGATDDYFKIDVVDTVKGRAINKYDIEEKRKVVLIGGRVKDVLFEPGEDAIGQYINIKGVYFMVVGTFIDASQDGRGEERAYIPYTSYQQIFNPKGDVQAIFLNVEDNASSMEVEANLKETLASRHKFSVEDNQAIRIVNLEKEYNRFMGVFFGIRSLVWFVGLGTLLAGIIGVSNIMIIIVKERTKEIGIRKAIGATPWSIVSLILQESVLITAVSGYMGLVLGVGILEGINYLLTSNNVKLQYFANPEINLNVAIIALLILVLAGVFAGLMPAIKASRIKPVEALAAD